MPVFWILAVLLNDSMGNIVHLHACMEYEFPNDLTGYGTLLFSDVCRQGDDKIDSKFEMCSCIYST